MRVPRRIEVVNRKPSDPLTTAAQTPLTAASRQRSRRPDRHVEQSEVIYLVIASTLMHSLRESKVHQAVMRSSTA
jgi:hypothetical protein